MPRTPNLKIYAKDDAAEIYIYDDIGPSWLGMVGAKGFADELKELGDVKNITVRINSPGGDVFEGLAIYNLLVNHNAQVSTEIDGSALSIAGVIAMAGDTIRMAENAMFMIHDPWGITYGNSAEIRKFSDTLDKIKDSLVGIFAKRTGQTADDLSAWMSDETWYSAEEAKDKGFVTEITENKGVEAKFDPDRFKNTPERVVQQIENPDVPYSQLRNFDNPIPPQFPRLVAAKANLRS